MQRAMPSSVGMWLGSFHDSLEDGLILIDAVIKIIDQNPLGSAAGTEKILWDSTASLPPKN